MIGTCNSESVINMTIQNILTAQLFSLFELMITRRGHHKASIQVVRYDGRIRQMPKWLYY